MRALGLFRFNNSSISDFTYVNVRRKSRSKSNFDLYLFFIASIAVNPVSQRYYVLKGINKFIALSEINPYSALLLSQKSLNKSLLNSPFNPPSHESSIYFVNIFFLRTPLQPLIYCKGNCKIWKSGLSARNVAQRGDHSMLMGQGIFEGKFTTAQKRKNKPSNK